MAKMILKEFDKFTKIDRDPNPISYLVAYNNALEAVVIGYTLSTGPLYMKN